MESGATEKLWRSRWRLVNFVIALHREETGILVMEFSEHLWPEDLELAIPAVHDAARRKQNSLLLLVKVAATFETSSWDLLRQILPRGILPPNRPSRIAVVTTTGEDRGSETQSKQMPEVRIRVFGVDQVGEAEAWLLSFATTHCLRFSVCPQSFNQCLILSHHSQA